MLLVYGFFHSGIRPAVLRRYWLFAETLKYKCVLNERQTIIPVSQLFSPRGEQPKQRRLVYKQNNQMPVV